MSVVVVSLFVVVRSIVSVVEMGVKNELVIVNSVEVFGPDVGASKAIDPLPIVVSPDIVDKNAVVCVVVNFVQKCSSKVENMFVVGPIVVLVGPEENLKSSLL